MRAKEFIKEATPTLNASQLASKTRAAINKEPADSTSTSTVPSQSASDLNNQQQQQRLNSLGNQANQQPDAQQQQKGKSTGFFSNLARGFKQGIGVNPDQGLIRGLAAKGLDSMGMRATADAMTDPVLKKGNGNTQGTIGSAGTQPKVGSMINDPRFGNVKVLPNSPGQKGIHLDTTKTLGHPIYIDPKDLQQ